MTNEATPPSAAQKLLGELGLWLDAMTPPANTDVEPALELSHTEIYNLLAHFRTLEKEHREMKDTLIAVSSGEGCPQHLCGIWASKTLSLLTNQ